jgi:thioredoxin reductase
MYDVIIVGGGPGGLSCALVLGRCCKRVLVCDKGEPRNAASHAMHAYLSRDGMPPSEFLKVSREQLRKYDTVEVRSCEVTAACRRENCFEVNLSTGEVLNACRLVLATGVVDEIPSIVGLKDLYGISVHHCPYCDGWEYRGKPIAVYGKGTSGHGLALELIGWTSDIVLCTDGDPELDEEKLSELEKNGITVRQEGLVRLEGKDGLLQKLVFANGDTLLRDGLFFSTPNHVRCNFAEQLGCEFTEKGAIAVGDKEGTPVPGLYCVGDASPNPQYVIVAAAEGAKAGIAINQELLQERLKR